ncbi:hypothetical protein BSKO_02507 [Bryopsis sp. KO-2023]|nr:hypothetical protein BSKO_02507 [Bryopsis sp. KO-2023]
MSKLLASTLLVLVLSTVGVDSRPVGFGNHFALAPEELVAPLLNGGKDWCKPCLSFDRCIDLLDSCHKEGAEGALFGLGMPFRMECCCYYYRPLFSGK